MKLRRLLICIMTAVMCLTNIPAMAEETPVTVMLDGEYIAFDVQPAIIDGRTLVPVRAIFEALGATVDWQGDTRTAISEMDGTRVSLQIDNTVMKVNDTQVILDVPAKLIDNRTLVPVRAISEAYDCYVDWNGAKRTVIIISDLSAVEMMSVNGAAISAGYFNYCLYTAQLGIADSLGTTVDHIAQMWTSSLGDITFDKYISEIACDHIVTLKSAATEAAKLGVKITKEDINKVEHTISTLKDSYSDPAEYAAELKLLGTTEADLRSYLTDAMYVNRLYSIYEKQYGMNDAQIKKYLDENYIQAQHVLISTEGLDDKQKQEKFNLAKDVLNKAKAGSDFAALVAQYGEDPGAVAEPDGYLFTKGEMVQEFETAAFALKVGSLSSIVETSYGYHIIKRVPNVYTDEIIDKTRTMLVSGKIDAVFARYIESAVVTKNENMFAVVVPVGI